MKRSSIVALALLLLVALAAFSQQREEYLSGTELLSYCQSGTMTHTGTWCLGYVLGVWHTTAPERQACAPSNITAGQLKAAVVRHLQHHPETLDGEPVDLVREALGQTFACQ